MANDQYRKRGLADIQKQEVPTVFDRRTDKGFPREKSIVDFIGFYIKPVPGQSEQFSFMPMSFDAKETRSTTRFDLSKSMTISINTLSSGTHWELRPS